MKTLNKVKWENNLTKDELRKALQSLSIQARNNCIKNEEAKRVNYWSIGHKSIK